MKNKPFQQRLRFALMGIRTTWDSESSFRTQVFMGLGAVGVLIFLRPEPIWWAIVLFVIGAVLAIELINTALESLIDHLHPEIHPMIARVKDCAAGAVLILSFSAVGILAALLFEKYKNH